VLIAGTAGYVLLGFGFVDALYQTVITISTVGFAEVNELETKGKVFTIAVILFGVGSTLYTFSTLLETLVEGRINDLFGRRRMERQIEAMIGHVVVCGAGRVGRATARAVAGMGLELVVADIEADRLEALPHPTVVGDVTEDAVLRQLGVERARVVIVALDSDAENLFVTLSVRLLAPEVYIVARARQENAEGRLRQAGADRIVNPQQIGGDRMAAFALQPNVAEFLDVVMHDRTLEFRLEEIEVTERSAICDQTLRDAEIRERTGAMILAVRNPAGQFVTNPSSSTVIEPKHVLIAIGTPDQLAGLAEVARPAR